MSVVIPCHNYADYLPDAIGSVLSQRGVVVEVIVVDDASSDDSAAVAAAFARRDSRVRLIRKTRNSGAVDTFNLGLDHVRFPFLVRLDADDLLTPGSLWRSTEVMRAEPSVGLVYGHPLHFTGDRPCARQSFAGWTVWTGADWLEDRCRSGVNVITSPEALMRMSVVRRVGGQRSLKHTHDMEMWMRLASAADVAYVLGVDQAWHREHPRSLSTRADDELGLIILRERRAAFQRLFGEPVPGVELDEALAATARRTLSLEAVRRAAYEYDRGRAPRRDIRPLAEFALETDPAIRGTGAWAALQRRMDAGERWAPRRPWLALRPLRRAAVDARRSRTWRRSGLYAHFAPARQVLLTGPMISTRATTSTYRAEGP